MFNRYNNVTYAQFIANPTFADFHRSLLTPINLFDLGAEPHLPATGGRPPLFLDTETKTYLATNEFYLNDVFSLADERVFVMGGLRYTQFNRKIITYASGTLPTKVRLAAPPTAYTIADATTKSDRPLTIATARGEPNWGPLPEWWRVDAIVGYKLRIPQSKFAWDVSA